MLVAVISDTHLPRGGRRLPERCFGLIARSDAVIHGGDFIAAAVLEDRRAIGPPVHAVHGNVDDEDLRRTLPASLDLKLEGAEISVLHDAGPARGRLERLRRRFPGAGAVIYGHSHLPDLQESDGFQIFNPGSPTERRRSPGHTMGLLRIEDARAEFEHVWLNPF
jgi:uncharacterized protein